MVERNDGEESGRTFRAMGLHALEYCERLFFLEEIEEIRLADENVWAGRRLHEELDEEEEVIQLTLESRSFGLRGKVDAVRRRDGSLYPIEHKRGRAFETSDGQFEAWDSDRLQAVAYALLLEEEFGERIQEARIRYHANNRTVRISITPDDRKDVIEAVHRARELASSTERPPVTTNERKCVKCSLAPVCLPEEARLAESLEESDNEQPSPVRLFPPDQEKRSLHVVTQWAKVRRSSSQLKVTTRDETLDEIGIRHVSDVVIHGHPQMTTQALRLCAYEDVPVHYVTMSGNHVGVCSDRNVAVQRRIRQFDGLSDEERCLRLCQRLVQAKIELQLHHVLRSSRGAAKNRKAVEADLNGIRKAIRLAHKPHRRNELLGAEGLAARHYFSALESLVSDQVDASLHPDGRTRRPPEDRFNSLLSFAYSMLYRDVMTAILRVGLEPGFGFFHQPRSAAPPLVLDIMELFRVPIVDMAVLGAVNRRRFHPEDDFRVTDRKVWLSDSGKEKLIEAYETRKHDEYRHPVLDYSLSYARMIELETRLLEKEWMDEEGLFARFRIR